MRRITAIMAIGIFSFINVNAQESNTKPFANPGFMFGTDLGKYMQTLYKIGKIDEMVKFTSSETIKKYGVAQVSDYYEDCGFGYDIKLVSMTGDGKYKTLSYNAKINATNKVVRMKVVLENDSAKVVLENLKIVSGN